VYVVPLSHILGRLPLVPAGDTGTIPYSMRDGKAACYEHGICDTDGKPGSGSCLFYINSWAMIWPTDYNVAPEWPVWWPFAVCDSIKTKPPKSMHSIFRCSRNPLLDMHRYTQILAHIHRYQQILTSKKTKASLYALSGLFTWAWVAISGPKTAGMGENISCFNRYISIHIWSYNLQKYFGIFTWAYLLISFISYISCEYLVNICEYQTVSNPLGAGI